MTATAHDATAAGLERSIGSLVGRLDPAGLAPEFGTGPVEVRCTGELAATIRAAQGGRVEVSGMLYRDGDDRVVRVEARGIEVLADTHPPLTDLVGLAPDLTGGLDVDDYLALIRGED